MLSACVAESSRTFCQTLEAGDNGYLHVLLFVVGFAKYLCCPNSLKGDSTERLIILKTDSGISFLIPGSAFLILAILELFY